MDRNKKAAQLVKFEDQVHGLPANFHRKVGSVFVYKSHGIYIEIPCSMLAHKPNTSPPEFIWLMTLTDLFNVGAAQERITPPDQI